MTKEHSKHASSTKSGPGRYHQQGAQKANATRRRVKGCGQFSLALRNVITRRNFEAIQAKRAAK